MGGAGPVAGPGASHVQFPEEIQEGSGSAALLLAPDASRMGITPLGGGRWAAVLPLKMGPRDPLGQWHRVQQLVNLGLPGGGAVSVTLKPIMQEAPAAKQIPSVETQPAAKVTAPPVPQASVQSAPAPLPAAHLPVPQVAVQPVPQLTAQPAAAAPPPLPVVPVAPQVVAPPAPQPAPQLVPDEVVPPPQHTYTAKEKASWLAWKPHDDTSQVSGMLKQLKLKSIPGAAQPALQSTESDQLLMPPVDGSVVPIPGSRPVASAVQVSEQQPPVRQNRFLDQPSDIQMPEAAVPQVSSIPSQPVAAVAVEPAPFTPPPPPAPQSQQLDQTARGLADFQQAFDVGSAPPASTMVASIQSPSASAFGQTVSAADASVLKQFSPDQMKAVQSLLTQQQAAMSNGIAGLAPLKVGTSQLQFSKKPSPWKPPSDDVNAIGSLLSKVEQLTGRQVHRPRLDQSGQPAFMRDLDEGSESSPAQAVPVQKRTYDWGTILGAARPK